MSNGWRAASFAAAGDLQRAREIVSGRLRQNPTAIAIAAAAHQPHWIELPAPGAPSRRAAHSWALLLRERGELREAAQVIGVNPTRRARALGAIIEQEIADLHATPPRASATRPQSTATSVVHMVTNALPEVRAGYTIRTHGIASAQARAGMRVTVATPPGFPVVAGRVPQAGSVALDGVTYSRFLPLHARSTPSVGLTARWLSETAVAADADVLHAHSGFRNGLAALSAARRLDLPVIYEMRGFLEETWASRGGSRKSDLFRWTAEVDTRVCHGATAVVTISKTMRDILLARGLPEEKISVIPNAIGRHYERVPDRVRARADLGLPHDELLIGTVSTLNPYEGIDTIITTGAELNAIGVPTTVLVVGDGPARPTLERVARESGVESKTMLIGGVSPEQAAVFHEALDVFLVPRVRSQLTEAVTPLKTLEAMASDTIVAVADLPPLREQVDDGVSGLVIDSVDPREWARAIREAIDVAHSPLARTARSWVVEHRTWDAAVRAYQELYVGAH